MLKCNLVKWIEGAVNHPYRKDDLCCRSLLKNCSFVFNINKETPLYLAIGGEVHE